MTVYTKYGEKITLTEPELASGGEGKVYKIDGYHMVAKIYNDKRKALSRESKIETMLTLSADYDLEALGVTEQIAWPLISLYDHNGNFVGFAMTQMYGHLDLDSMYVYPPNKNAHVTIKDRIEVLINLCSLIESVHQLGQVFGDFNPDNIKINKDNTVCFMDADSFHIRYQGMLHKCVVCAPGYVAPEVVRAVSGTTYAACQTLTFTKYSDYFALAIHVFRMLHNGAHPFVAQYDVDAMGSLPAPEPIDHRVCAGATPYFKSIPYEHPPAYAPSLKSLPSYLYRLFERAFVTELNNPTSRPSAKEWKIALIQYKSQLFPCRQNNTHYYLRGLAACPYCQADENVTKLLFRTITPTKAGRKGPAKTPTPPKTTPNNSKSAPAQSKMSQGNYLGNGKYYANKKQQVSKLNTVTAVIAFFVQLFLGANLFANIYSNLFTDPSAIKLCVVGGFFFSFLGLYIHNKLVTQNRSPKTGDYLTAILVCFLFSLLFIPIALLLGLLGGFVGILFKGVCVFILACILLGIFASF